MADSDSRPYGLIYVVTNKGNGKKYVGQTVSSLKSRWSGHRRSDSACRALAASIKKHGKDNFTIEEIANAESRDELNSLEQFYVETLQTMVPFGYNIKAGGGAKGKWPEEYRMRLSASLKAANGKPEVRARMAESRSKYWADPESRRVHSLALKKANESPEAREAKRIAMIAVWANPEFKASRIANMSNSEKRVVRSDEYRAKMREIFIGRKFSEETRAKMSAAAIRRKREPMSDEQKKKLAAANTGRVFTDEHRAKLSAARKRRIDLERLTTT